MQKQLKNLGLIEEAIVLAKSRNHIFVASEHLTYVLVQSSDIQEYLGIYMLNPESIIQSQLDTFEHFQATSYKPGMNEIILTPAVQNIVSLAENFLSQTNGAKMMNAYIFAALLADGNNIGKHVIEKISNGEVTAFDFMQKSMSINGEFLIEQSLEKLSKKKQVWEEMIISDGPDSKMELNPFDKVPQLPELNDEMQGPTEESNQIVPGRVFNGRKPGGYYEKQMRKGSELDLLIKGRITTFVCLIGEYTSSKFFQQSYPQYIQNLITGTKKQIKVIHFKVDDFSIRSADHTNKIVQHLGQLVQNGEILYIHCLGGHGRTGTISIPLMTLLYGMSAEEAMQKVNYYHQARAGGHTWCSMPEDEDQLIQIQNMEMIHKRGNARANIKNKSGQKEQKIAHITSKRAKLINLIKSHYSRCQLCLCVHQYTYSNEPDQDNFKVKLFKSKTVFTKQYETRCNLGKNMNSEMDKIFDQLKVNKI